MPRGAAAARPRLRSAQCRTGRRAAPMSQPARSSKPGSRPSPGRGREGQESGKCTTVCAASLRPGPAPSRRTERAASVLSDATASGAIDALATHTVQATRVLTEADRGASALHLVDRGGAGGVPGVPGVPCSPGRGTPRKQRTVVWPLLTWPSNYNAGRCSLSSKTNKPRAQDSPACWRCRPSAGRGSAGMAGGCGEPPHSGPSGRPRPPQGRQRHRGPAAGRGMPLLCRPAGGAWRAGWFPPSPRPGGEGRKRR